MITCPNCSTSNPDGTQTCLSCGAPLVEAADLPINHAILPVENEIPEPSHLSPPNRLNLLHPALRTRPDR